MATEPVTTIPPQPAAATYLSWLSGLRPYRLTVAQFDRMTRAGVFQRGERIELLGGLLVKKMTTYDPHDFAVDQLGHLLDRILPVGWIARQEKWVVLGRYWRPRPDISVARGLREHYRTRAPRRRDLAMLAEVADSSFARDRGSKWVKYAAVRIPIYWIVNLPERRVEVYSSPSGRGKAAVYQLRADFGPDQEVPVMIEGSELGRITVSEIL